MIQYYYIKNYYIKNNPLGTNGFPLGTNGYKPKQKVLKILS